MWTVVVSSRRNKELPKTTTNESSQSTPFLFFFVYVWCVCVCASYLCCLISFFPFQASLSLSLSPLSLFSLSLFSVSPFPHPILKNISDFFTSLDILSTSARPQG